MTRTCDNCGREITVGEPYTSYDFMTQRFDEDGNVQILEGQELTVHCVACGYDRRDEVTGMVLGFVLPEEVVVG